MSTIFMFDLEIMFNGNQDIKVEEKNSLVWVS